MCITILGLAKRERCKRRGIVGPTEECQWNQVKGICSTNLYTFHDILVWETVFLCHSFVHATLFTSIYFEVHWLVYLIVTDDCISVRVGYLYVKSAERRSETQRDREKFGEGNFNIERQENVRFNILFQSSQILLDWMLVLSENANLRIFINTMYRMIVYMDTVPLGLYWPVFFASSELILIAK